MDNALAAEIAGKKTNIDPDAINERGVKWWFDRVTHIGEKCKKAGVQAWLVIDKEGKVSRLLTYKNEVVYENTNLEAIGCMLDIWESCPDLIGKVPEK